MCIKFCSPAIKIVICGLSLLACFNSIAQEAPRPNIVYILADDMGLGDVRSYTNNSPVNTPNIDSLASAGMRFTNAHSPSAVCSPTRYGILTGQYAWRTQLTSGVVGPHESALIDNDRDTVADFLQSNGYNTAAIGKWHLGMNWATTDGNAPQANGSNVDYTQPFTGGPTDLGFDTYFGDDIINWAPYTFIENSQTVGIPSLPFGNGLQTPGYAQIDVLPEVTARAVQYIGEQAATDDPFFLYMPLTAPHSPILPPDFIPDVGTEYDRFIATVDWSVGQVLDALAAQGIGGETMIIFAADNGVSKNFSTSDNISPGFIDGTALRGQKADIHEAGHRIPMIVRWDGQVQAGAVSAEYVELNDFFATTVDMLGGHLYAGQAIAEDSVSLLPVLLGEEIDGTLRTAGVNHSFNGTFAIRQFDEEGNEWKLIFSSGTGGFTNPRGTPLDPTQPITDFNDLQLYNLTDDVGETTNVLTNGISLEERAIVEHLQAILTEYITSGQSVSRGILGDLDGDGFVADEDLNIILANWGQSVTLGSLTQGDLTSDGIVGLADLNIVLDNWPNGEAPDVNVPEPTSALGFGALMFAIMRRP